MNGLTRRLGVAAMLLALAATATLAQFRPTPQLCSELWPMVDSAKTREDLRAIMIKVGVAAEDIDAELKDATDDEVARFLRQLRLDLPDEGCPRK